MIFPKSHKENLFSTHFFEREEEIRPLFESQLRACGVDYFDFYLMHAQSADIFAKFKQCRAYETALKSKEEGKIRHFGISFHDKASVLEAILTEYPQIEVVQIQFNYLDYDDPSVESRKCYEVCRKFHKPVIVMEPCKGGNLVSLPEDAKVVFETLHGGNPESYAIRFAAGFDDMMMVLSGMSNILIVYYSRKGQNYWSGSTKDLKKGNTEIVAEMIRDAVGGDLFEVDTVKPYSEDYTTCTEEVQQELRENARPELKKYMDSLDGYDTVFVGYPKMEHGISLCI